MTRVQHAAGAIAERTWSLRAELLVAAAFLGGWFLVTLGIASYTSTRVWPISLGILLLSLCGWKWVWNLTSVGLYTLGGDEDTP